MLAIDHDADLGYWAVRGVLCQTCNANLGREMTVVPGRDEYLGNAWHLRHRRGYEPIPLPYIPHASIDEASHLLHAAKEDVEAAAARGPGDRTRARNAMREAVRIATKAGMRQCEIVAAIDRVWGREKVYYALHERGRRVA